MLLGRRKKNQTNKSLIMSSIEQQSKGKKKDGEIRYLTP
jgi:hypothetical protein